MQKAKTVINLNLHMLYAGRCKVGKWWNYKNIVSPFYRILFIISGQAAVFIENRRYELSGGEMLLIPKYSCHSYECSNNMEHIYICFIDDMPGSKGIPSPQKLNLHVKATDLDRMLADMYLNMNHGRDLPVFDPQLYNDNSLPKEDISEIPDIKTTIQSQGILMQLFSRFLNDDSAALPRAEMIRLDNIFKYIESNLDKKISVTELSRTMHVTADHFSKIFKKATGLSPHEYIYDKRMERAKALLASTDMENENIGKAIGIQNVKTFVRLFTKKYLVTPEEWKHRYAKSE